MAEKIPKVIQYAIAAVLFAILGFLGNRMAVCADRLDERCTNLESKLAASEQDRRDIREALGRIENGVSELVKMHVVRP